MYFTRKFQASRLSQHAGSSVRLVPAELGTCQWNDGRQSPLHQSLPVGSTRSEDWQPNSNIRRPKTYIALHNPYNRYLY